MGAGAIGGGASGGAAESEAAPWIRLYVEHGAPLPQVAAGSAAREWFASEMYRCLPLTIGNQLGWTVLNPAAFSVTWDGSDGPDGVSGTSEGAHVQARFGHGTFSILPGFFVRTSADVDVIVKGVPNRPKDGVACLEAVIETDWFDGPFLVSMRLTRPGVTVSWERGEPLFQLVPYPRGWLRRFRTEVVTHGADHVAFFESLERWYERRMASMEPLLRGEAPTDPFDGRYRRGVRSDGTAGSSRHQTSLDVPGFGAHDSRRPRGEGE